MPFQWPEGQRLAFSLVVGIETEATERASDADIRYGLRAGFPRLTDLLLEYPVKATFAVPPALLERETLLGEFIGQRGHEAALNAGLPADSRAWQTWLRVAVDSMRITCSRRPLGWYARELPTRELASLLAAEGFRYCSADADDDEPGFVPGEPRLVNLPRADDTSDLRFLNAPALSADAWLQYAIDTLDVLSGEGENAPRVMTVTVHPHVIGRPGRINALEQFLQYVSSRDDVWVATRSEIAAHYATEPPTE